MKLFEAKFDGEGKLLVPRTVFEGMKNQKLVMVFENGEFKVLPKVRAKGMDFLS